MPVHDLVDSDILLIVPREQAELSRALGKRFAGVPGVSVIEDRRCSWPRGERRRKNPVVIGVERPWGQERRQGQRRGSHDARFVGALREPARA